jgi:hydroxyacylglutathione hydrolase
MVFKDVQSNPQLPSVSDITAEELLLHCDEVQLIDVRSEQEFTGELGHIPGAILISLNLLPLRLKEISKDKPVVFICRSGNRSAHAAALAIKERYTHVFNLKGGMLRWNALKLDVDYAG